MRALTLEISSRELRESMITYTCAPAMCRHDSAHLRHSTMQSRIIASSRKRSQSAAHRSQISAQTLHVSVCKSEPRVMKSAETAQI